MDRHEREAATLFDRARETAQLSDESIIETQSYDDGAPEDDLGYDGVIPRKLSQEPLTHFSSSAFESRYSDRGEIAQGGMGEVRIIQDMVIGREVAGKFLSRRFASQPRVRARFIREACLQGKLEHPSIVPVHDVGVSPEGQPFFTMKRVRGMTLREIIEGLRSGSTELAGKFSRRKLLTAFSNVCLTIAFAHDKGVVHRDLKPSNIMLGDFGETYVLDWGIAEFIGAPDAAESVEEVACRVLDMRDGQIFGTAGYMAPEQVGRPAEAVTTSADIYSLGAVLFEILTLEPLNPGATPAARIRSTLDYVPAHACTLFPERQIPVELEAICLKATAFLEHQRYASVREMHDALERFLDGDRDQALRRELAARYVEQAEAAQHQAQLVPPEQEAKYRSQAISNLGRAIALDSDQGQAMARLVELLLDRPRTSPPAVKEEVEGALRRNERVLSRTISRVCVGALPAIPLGLYMGVRDWLSFGVMSVALLLVIAVHFIFIRRIEGDATRARIFSVVIGAIGVAMTARQFGPLFLTPFLFLGYVVGISISPVRRVRVTGLALALTAEIAMGLLDWLQVWPPSYVFTADYLTVLPRMLDFPPHFTFGYLLAMNVSGILLIGLAVHRFRRAMEAAEERIQLHAWQLRQLLPQRL